MLRRTAYARHPAGANDYFSTVFQDTSVTAKEVVGYIEDAMQQLFARGARR